MGGYDFLLFDLGGVLADFTGLIRLKGLLPRQVDIEDIRRQWLMSPAVKRFETGGCGTEEFAWEFLKEWKISLSPSQFVNEFTSWVTGPYEGIMNLLVSLKREYCLVCLTNCNELHWDWVTEKSGFKEVFHHLYSSHIIGLAKPDSAVFEYVLSDLETDPDRMVFFDDSPMNVENASLLGIESHLVAGAGELKRKLRELGIIGYH